MIFELAKYSKNIDGEALEITLQQMISPAANPKEDVLKLVTSEYIKYKQSYVKHLQFDPDLQNLSKFFISPTPL